MDPYLEDPALWPNFHHQFVTVLYQVLLPGLVDRYRAQVERRSYLAGNGEMFEEYLEIRKRTGPLVTLIDVVTMANKTTPEGRTTYLETRRAAKDAKANIVEIDLLLQGAPMLDYSRENMPEWNYAVTVTRATQPERYEVYTSTLQKRLPRFRLPLASDDRDTVVDLQVAFSRAFGGNFEKRIDYRRDPVGFLSAEDHRWIDEPLQEHHLRGPTPLQDEVARLAYYFWEQQGRPHGKDQEHWLRALTELRRPKPSAKGPCFS
jgi:hypothetical protein